MPSPNTPPSAISGSTSTSEPIPLHVSSVSNLETEISTFCSKFDKDEKKDEDWKEQDAALQRLRGLCRGNVRDIKGYISYLRPAAEHIAKTMLSLRTALVITNCATVIDMANSFGTDLDPLVDVFMTDLFKSCGQSKKVTASAALDAIKVVLQKTSYQQKYLNQFYTALHDRSTPLRTVAASVSKFALEVMVSSEEKRRALQATGGLNLMEDILRKGLQDASGIVRQTCREAYAILKAHWPERAESLLRSLDVSTQRTIIREEGSTTRPTTARPARPGFVRPKRRTRPEQVPSSTEDVPVIEAQNTTMDISLVINSDHRTIMDLQESMLMNGSPESSFLAPIGGMAGLPGGTFSWNNDEPAEQAMPRLIDSVANGGTASVTLRGLFNACDSNIDNGSFWDQFFEDTLQALLMLLRHGNENGAALTMSSIILRKLMERQSSYFCGHELSVSAALIECFASDLDDASNIQATLEQMTETLDPAACFNALLAVLQQCHMQCDSLSPDSTHTPLGETLDLLGQLACRIQQDTEAVKLVSQIAEQNLESPVISVRVSASECLKNIYLGFGECVWDWIPELSRKQRKLLTMLLEDAEWLDTYEEN